VGLLQVRLLCEGAELSGLTMGEALEGMGHAEVCVVVMSASVYEPTVRSAKRSTGLVELRPVSFPSPQRISINMMPFIMGEITSLPKEYHDYWPLICNCNLGREEFGKVCYLTIQESEVAAGRPQRRQGLHLETPAMLMRAGRVVELQMRWGGGRAEPPQLLRGGIYTASTVDESCRAWDMRFAEPEDVVGALGNAEHLRELLGEGTFLESNTLYWMTDATPHESVALKESTLRQYFRLVTSSVSVWYERHSTPNPLGVAPDPKTTRIVTHDKFAELTSEALGRRGDETWDFAGAEVGICMEEEWVQKSIEAGEMLELV